MDLVRLRYLADVNPSTPKFDRLDSVTDVTFMPLESVWSDDRLDLSRTQVKSLVSTGYTRFANGDVLVPKVTPTFQAARSALAIDLCNGVGAGSTELHVLRAREGVDARWIRYATQSRRFLGEGVAAFQGVAGLQRVPEEFISNFTIADVSLADQRRIADFLDEQVTILDRAITLRTREGF